MANLIRLADIPYAARAAESAARKACGTKAQALEFAPYRIDSAPGCHSEPYFDPPCVGWVVARAAAQALVERLTHMPGGTSHRRLACSQLAQPDAVQDCA